MAENIPANGLRKIGIVGIGTMGFNIAKALITVGHTVFVCDKNKQRTIKAQEIGARPVESPQTGARLTDITLLSLPMPADVTAVM
jgi:3-hydroxyisobutyrate dehydrogenase-like beta-hydroxyacid dehydrogenase